MSIFFLWGSLIGLIGYSALFLYFRKGFKRLDFKTCSEQKKVSLIIPANNEADTLPILLSQLAKQNYPAEMTEIVLIDDRSNDGTWEIMTSFQLSYQGVKTLQITDRKPNISPKKRAITEGIDIASGEIILTTDADSKPGKEWIKTMVSYYTNNTEMVLGYAPYRNDKPYNSLFHNCLALDYFGMGAITAATTGMGLPVTCNGANLSYKKSLFRKVDGFGETINWMSGDDDLFLHRVQQTKKTPIRYAVNPSSAVFNDPPNTFKDFFRQRIRFASKHRAYPRNVLLVLFWIFGFYCFLAGLFIHAFFDLNLLPALLFILGIKAFFEIHFLLPAQKLLEKRNLLRFYPLAVIPHIFYVVLFPVLGQIMPKKW